MSRAPRPTARRLPSVRWLRSRQSWTLWRQSRATRRLVRQLEQTQAQLALLAQREARLQVALQLQGLTQSAQLLRAQELLADLQTPEQQPPPPEPPSLAWEAEATTVPVAELRLPMRPELDLEELEPMPTAEEQLWSQLGGPSSTLPSSHSSET